MPRLLLKFNAAVIKEIPLDKPEITVGRKPDNDVVIDNPAVSGHHCRVLHAGDTYYVEDLDSTNGTFVNEKRVVKSGLKHNDVIGLAKHALVFVDEAAPAAEPKAGPGAEETVKLDGGQAQEMLRASAAGAAPKDGKTGALRVLKGGSPRRSSSSRGSPPTSASPTGPRSRSRAPGSSSGRPRWPPPSTGAPRATCSSPSRRAIPWSTARPWTARSPSRTATSSSAAAPPSSSS